MEYIIVSIVPTRMPNTPHNLNSNIKHAKNIQPLYHEWEQELTGLVDVKCNYKQLNSVTL